MRKMALLFLGISMAFISILFFNAEPAKAASPLTVYTNSYFGGTSQSFDVGSYLADDLTLGNDQISSIKVSPGYEVFLYSDNNYGGTMKCFTSVCYDFSTIDFNDCVSSIKVVNMGAEAPVILYSDSEYQNGCQPLSVGSYNASDLYWNDAVSSVRVAPGYKVTFYTNSGYSGTSSVVTNDIYNMDDIGMNDCVSSVKIEAVAPTIDSSCTAVPGNAYTSSSEASLMLTYSPRVWLSSGELYKPSSVDWAIQYMTRYANGDEGNQYCYKTTTALSSPSAKLAYFSGNLSSAKVYSYWVQKERNCIDISYFYYYPYNLGKTVLGTEFGDHVSDWEHVTVRLQKFTYNNVSYVRPIQVAYPYHSLGATYQWSSSNVEKYNTTHPIAYSAYGSHGNWPSSGNHAYITIAGLYDLVDVCSAGTAWDATSSNLLTMAYFPQTLTGNGLGSTAWPGWMNRDYTNSSGTSVYKWGNNSSGSYLGQDLLADGPTGPQEKPALTDYYNLR